MTTALRTRLAILERGRKSEIPLVIAEDCKDLAQLVAEAKRQGRAALIVSAIDERL